MFIGCERKCSAFIGFARLVFSRKLFARIGLLFFGFGIPDISPPFFCQICNDLLIAGGFGTFGFCSFLLSKIFLAKKNFKLLWFCFNNINLFVFLGDLMRRILFFVHGFALFLFLFQFGLTKWVFTFFFFFLLMFLIGALFLRFVCDGIG